MSNRKVQIFRAGNFTLQNGAILPNLAVAYEAYGSTTNAKDNTILLLHGYTSNPHAAGGGDSDPGWWENLIGPHRAIDTNQYYVVSPNMLGSAYGTTGPGSKNPNTGKPYGPDFPEFTTRDMIEVNQLLLEHLGAHQLAAVIGYSYGGYLTFQWGVTYPARMRALVPVATGITGRGDEGTVRELEVQFEAAAGWNSGHYYGSENRVHDTLIQFRSNILRNYGVITELKDKGFDDTEAEHELHQQAANWADGFDANSLIALRRCATRFDARPEADKISAPLLYILANTDNLFGPALGEKTVDYIRNAAGVDARYFELESPYGHRAPSVDWAKWEEALRSFLDAFAAPDAKTVK